MSKTKTMGWSTKAGQLAYRATIAFVGLAIIGALSIIVLATPRGFDWSDESWAYSLILNNKQTPREPWGFQHLLHPLFSLLGESVLLFRVLRLVGYVAVGLAASYSFLRLSDAMSWTLNRGQRTLLLFASQFGTIHAYSYPPRIVSYNEVSSWIIQVFLILVILVFSAQHSPLIGSRRVVVHNLWLAGLGVLLPLQFAARFTTFVLQIPLLIGALVVIAPSKRLLAQHTRWIVVGATSGTVLLLILRFPFGNYLHNLRMVFFDKEVQKGYGHSIDEILKIYKSSVLDAFQQSRSVFAVLVIVLLLIFIGKTSGWGGYVLSSASAILVVVSFGATTRWSREDNWRLLGIAIVLLVALLVFLTAVTIRSGLEATSQGKRLRLSGLFLMIIVGPTSVAIGTNNAIAGQFLLTSTLWVTYVAGLLLVLIGSSFRTHLFSLAVASSVVLAQLGVVSIAAFKRDVTVRSYGTTAYFRQQQASHVPFLKGIYLTQQQADWSDWIATTAHDLDAAHVPTIAIDTPGALLVFNNSNAASPWISSFWPGSLLTISDACRRSGLRGSKFYVLQDDAAQPGDPWWKSVSSEFAKCDILFPADFTVAAQRASARVALGNTTVWLHESHTG